MINTAIPVQSTLAKDSDMRTTPFSYSAPGAASPAPVARPELLPIPVWPHPWPSQAAWRHLLFDAHANGLCDAPRQGKVAGEIKGKRYVASALEFTGGEAIVREGEEGHDH